MESEKTSKENQNENILIYEREQIFIKYMQARHSCFQVTKPGFIKHIGLYFINLRKKH